MTRVLVVGCGAIGGTVTALMSEHGASEVVAFTTNASVVKATQDGILVRDHQERRVSAQVVSTLDALGTFDFVLLATRPLQVEDAARQSLPHLAEDGAFVCFQNGLCEERIAAVAGDPGRVFGAVVAWGASMPEPGVVERTSSGGFAIGRMDGADDPRLNSLATLLEPIGPVDVTDNLAGVRWSKLAINCAISSLGTIGGDTLGKLMRHRVVRRVALEIMTEVVHVARAEDVRLEKVAGTLDLNFMALKDAERASHAHVGLVAKHSLLLAVGARYRRLRSSMLRAIENGRTPAVDFLNGEIVTRGQTHGIATPVNETTREFVHAIARGERTSSLQTLRDLAARVL